MKMPLWSILLELHPFIINLNKKIHNVIQLTLNSKYKKEAKHFYFSLIIGYFFFQKKNNRVLEGSG